MSGAEDDGPAPAHYWLLPGRLMGGEWPVPHLDWLAHERISVLVNLTDLAYRDDRFLIHRIPLPDGEPPDGEQIMRFCQLVWRELREERRIYVHCLAGCGRTGTMMACYLAYRDRLGGDEAIRRIRALRSCSIETDAQEAAVIGWGLRMQTTGYRLSSP